jgi:uncharacterized protein YfiM (DUF2279 family)
MCNFNISAAQFSSMLSGKQMLCVYNVNDSTITNTCLSVSRFLSADKAQHFIGSTISTIFLAKFAHQNTKSSKQKSKRISISLTLSLGILKEVRDKYRPNNHFSWIDLLADGAGILMGVVLLNQP